jgi:hypothetical protein
MDIAHQITLEMHIPPCQRALNSAFWNVANLTNLEWTSQADRAVLLDAASHTRLLPTPLGVKRLRGECQRQEMLLEMTCNAACSHRGISQAGTSHAMQ